MKVSAGLPSDKCISKSKIKLLRNSIKSLGRSPDLDSLKVEAAATTSRIARGSKTKINIKITILTAD